MLSTGWYKEHIQSIHTKRIHIKEYFILQRIVIATDVLTLLRGHVVQAKYIVLYRRDKTEQLGNRYGDLSLSYMERGT